MATSVSAVEATRLTGASRERGSSDGSALVETVGEEADRAREVERLVPLHHGPIIVVDHERRALGAARLNERGLEVARRQLAAVDAADAERAPSGDRLPGIEADQRRVEAGGRLHLAAPGLAALP